MCNGEIRVIVLRVQLVSASPRAREGQLFLRFGEERVPTKVKRVAGVTLLEGDRAERDLRGAFVSERPREGEFVFLYGVGEDGLEPLACTVSNSRSR